MKDFALQQKERGVEGAEGGQGDDTAVEELTIDSFRDTIIIKEPIPLPIIYFDFDKHYIRETEKDKLYPIVELLLKNPDYLISIHGHADERGTVGYNKVLSTNRALSVYEYLLDHDIAPERMRIYGHGELTIIERSGLKLERQNDRIVSFRLHYKEFNEPSMDD
jgi:outer membrane protein OmpA-like peptidoglycan-associated protein